MDKPQALWTFLRQIEANQWVTAVGRPSDLGAAAVDEYSDDLEGLAEDD